jgi:hypothetical protein
MMLTGGKRQEHLDNAREILTDFVTLGPGEIAKRNEQRKPRMRLLPYGIPLCMGYVAALFYFNS